jgi:IS5 family transposase
VERRGPDSTQADGLTHGDKGHDYRTCRTALRGRGITARIARKGIASSARLGRHRYVIERTLERITQFLRLARRYERIATHLDAFIRLACAVICYRRCIRTGVPLTDPE